MWYRILKKLSQSVHLRQNYKFPGGLQLCLICFLTPGPLNDTEPRYMLNKYLWNKYWMFMNFLEEGNNLWSFPNLFTKRMLFHTQKKHLLVQQWSTLGDTDLFFCWIFAKMWRRRLNGVSYIPGSTTSHCVFALGMPSILQSVSFSVGAGKCLWLRMLR